MSAARIPLVIDVDTGTDDAVCVISAVSCPSEIDILGFTTVCGNVGVEKTSRNTLDLVEFLGHPAPVYVGAAAPLLRAPIHARSHGESGLGDVVLPAASGLFGKGDASDFIYRVASQQAGGIELLAVGPLTNLAVALARYPDLREKINHITLMGGGIRGGNMTIASEFNFYVDPEAAQAVFESGCKITMVGLDVTLLPRLPDWVFDAVSGGDRPVHRLTAQIMSYMRRRSIDGGGDEPNVHDMIALAARLQPHLFTFEDYYVHINLEGEITRGMSVADFNNVSGRPPNARVATGVDADGLWRWFIGILDLESQQAKTSHLGSKR